MSSYVCPMCESPSLLGECNDGSPCSCCELCRTACVVRFDGSVRNISDGSIWDQRRAAELERQRQEREEKNRGGRL